MNRPLRSCAAWTTLHLLAATAALAQNPPSAAPPQVAPPVARPAAPDQRAAGPDLNALLRGGTQVAQMIDAGQAAELWDNASPAVRPKLSTAQFVAGLQKRLALGQAQTRKWVQTHTISATPGDGAPPGRYVAIEFTATFRNRQTLSELITLRQDEDQIWRFVGYANP